MEFYKTDEYKNGELSQMYRVTARRLSTLLKLGQQLVQEGIYYEYGLGEDDDVDRELERLHNMFNVISTNKDASQTMYILIWNDNTFLLSKTYTPERMCMNYITMKDIPHFVKLVKEELQ